MRWPLEAEYVHIGATPEKMLARAGEGGGGVGGGRTGDRGIMFGIWQIERLTYSILECHISYLERGEECWRVRSESRARCWRLDGSVKWDIWSSLVDSRHDLSL